MEISNDDDDKAKDKDDKEEEEEEEAPTTAAITTVQLVTTTVAPPLQSSHLSGAQQQTVDAAFQKLFGYTWGTAFGLSDAAVDKRTAILISIFGPTEAAQLLQSTVETSQRKHFATVSRSKRVANRKAQHYKAVPPQKKAAVTVTTAVPTNPQTRALKTATAAATNNNANATAAGVDSLLDQLKDGKETTVTAKTAADWDQFKDTTGLGSKLEQHAVGKNAFLKKQDFLQRVDHRKFDLERQERDKVRSKRGN
jgi:hypothetical protein